MGLNLFAPSPYQAAHQNRPAAYIPNAQRDGLLLRIIKMLNDHFQKKKKKEHCTCTNTYTFVAITNSQSKDPSSSHGQLRERWHNTAEPLKNRYENVLGSSVHSSLFKVGNRACSATFVSGSWHEPPKIDGDINLVLFVKLVCPW